MIGHRRAQGPAVAVIVTVAAIALLATAPVADATFPGRNGDIAYTDDTDCGVIAAIRPDGTGRRALTSVGDLCSGHATAPSWSPDGRRLIFAEGSAGSGLGMVDADGSNRISIPLAPAPASPQLGPEFVRAAPSMAPDGRRLAYVRYYGVQSRRPEIWVASIDGTEDRRLRAGTSPSWSPDGRRIAFVRAPKSSYTPAEGATWLMSAQTGRLVRRLSLRSLLGTDWSPDGRRLVGSVGQQLFIFRTQGAPARPRLLRTPRARRAGDQEAAWAPVGRRIAFVRHVAVRPFPNAEFDDRWEIWTISPRGKSARRIWTRHDHYDSDRGGPQNLSWQALPR